MCLVLKLYEMGLMEITNAAQPRVNLTRLSLRSRLREGAAKNPCQPGRGSQITGQVTPMLGGLAIGKTGKSKKR